MATPTGPVARDWYAVLRVDQGASVEDITTAVERLSRQATALATTAPERSQQLRETIRAMKGDLLSGPQARQRYDESRAAAARAVPAFPGPPSAASAPAAGPPPAGPPPAGPPPPGSPPGSGPPGSAPPGSGPPGSGPPGSAPPAWPPAPPGWPGAPAWSAGPAGPAGGPAGPAGPGLGHKIARFLRTAWTCPQCGTSALPSDKFCGKCGTPIQAINQAPEVQRVIRPVCAGCGRALSVSDTFCTHCGTRRQP